MPAKMRWLSFLFVLAIVGVWEAASRTNLVDPSYLPPFTAVLRAFVADFTQGEILRQVLATMRSYVQGLSLALAVGIPCGVLMGAFPGFYAGGRTLLEFLRPIPSVAVIPIAILLLGIEFKMRTAVVFYGSLWPVLLNTLYGIYDVDPVYVDTARVFGRRRGNILRAVVLPAALPYIFTGVRIASAIALILAVTSEMVAGSSGLGFYVKTSEMSLRVGEMYGGILLTGILGYLLNVGFLSLEKVILGWHRGFQGQRSRG
ncbi:MAG: ABC transporter permease [Candidatus Tectomicrobia bacterium]|uniref:ABC transporter permease n=1 Tax=Tectimicrobiota bacterium TaxID=2528274 RepID=A0A932GPT8_UNCTE|nr:ABC transporter permease [Candidatus Tectomicrobia bacterium]